MPVPFLDLKLQYAALKEELDQVLIRIAASQQFILGPEVEALEEEMAEYLGVPHAIGVASGTDALLLPLKALDPEPGDEVILPAFTFFATAGAAWNAGFKPVFCDVDPHTFNVTSDTLEAVWTHRTRAVVPVHLYGQMAPMRSIRALASGKGAFVLEDAAQAVGARQRVPAAELGPQAERESAREGDSEVEGGPKSGYGAGTGGESNSGGGAGTGPGASDGRGSRRTLREEDAAEGWAMAGALGNAGAFSFFPTKNLGGFGDGGLVTTGDEVLADRIAKLRVHGGRQMYHHEMVGTNSRLDALQAAVLRVKLPHLDAWAEGRRRNARLYHQLLDGVDEVSRPVVEEGNDHVYNQYTLRVHRRDELREYLGERGLASGLYYPKGLHLQECFAGLGGREGDLPVTERLTREVVSLPIYPELTQDQIVQVADAIRAFYAPGA